MKPNVSVGEYVLDAGKLAPPAAVTTAATAGYSLQDWVAIVTILYTVLMTLHLIYKFFKERNDG
ncbi:hypothetical protein [Sphingomonas sp.]